MNRRVVLLVSLFALPFLFTLAASPLSAQNPPAQNPQPAPQAQFSYAAQIPASFVHNLIFIPVRINGGIPSLFELDSSAERTSIEPARAKELGLAITPAQTVNQVELTMPGLRLGIGAIPVIERKILRKPPGWPLTAFWAGISSTTPSLSWTTCARPCRFWIPPRINTTVRAKPSPSPAVRRPR